VGKGGPTAFILRSAAAAAWDLRASVPCGGREGGWGLPADARGWASVDETKVCPPVWCDGLEQIAPICVFELSYSVFS